MKQTLHMISAAIVLLASTSLFAATPRFVVLSAQSTCNDALVAMPHYRAQMPFESPVFQLKQNLDHIVAMIMKLDGLAKPEISKPNRLGFTEADADQAQALVNEISQRLVVLRDRMASYLVEARAAAVKKGATVNTERLKFELSVYNEFNNLLAAIKSVRIAVILPNKWWFDGKEPIYLVIPKPIGLNIFDFTSGFAKTVVAKNGHGVVLFMNPVTGQIHVKIADYDCSIAVVGVNYDGSPIYETGRDRISSAYNPVTGTWQAFHVASRHSVSVYFDPNVGEVRPLLDQAINGAVYNPLRNVVETCGRKESGNAGYFDPIQKKVVWESFSGHGISILYRDENNVFHSSTGIFINYPSSD